MSVKNSDRERISCENQHWQGDRISITSARGVNEKSTDDNDILDSRCHYLLELEELPTDVQITQTQRRELKEFVRADEPRSPV